MAFRDTIERTYYDFATRAASHSCLLPECTIGDALQAVVFVAWGDGSVPAITTPPGWEENGTSRTASLSGNADSRIAFYARVVCDGTEGQSGALHEFVDFVTDMDTAAEILIIRVPAWFNRSTRIAIASQNSVLAETHDPPQVSPSWSSGAADDLTVVTGLGLYAVDDSVTGFPTNYTGGSFQANGGASSSTAGMASAVREINAMTEDPGIFTVSGGNGSERCFAWTIAFGSYLEPSFVGNYHVQNIEDDTVYYNLNETTSTETFSAIKLLTALVCNQTYTTQAAQEAVTVTITAGDDVGGSGDNLDVDDQIDLYQLNWDMLLESSNVAAQAIARTVGDALGGAGGVTRFLAEMETVATSIGMQDHGTINSPDGFSSSTNTSARDITALLAACADDPLITEKWGQATHTLELILDDSLGSGTSFTIEKAERSYSIFPAPSEVIGIKAGGSSGDLVTIAYLWTTPSGDRVAIGQKEVSSDSSGDAPIDDVMRLLKALVDDHPSLLSEGGGDPNTLYPAAAIMGL